MRNDLKFGDEEILQDRLSREKHYVPKSAQGEEEKLKTKIPQKKKAKILQQKRVKNLQKKRKVKNLQKKMKVKNLPKVKNLQKRIEESSDE